MIKQKKWPHPLLAVALRKASPAPCLPCGGMGKGEMTPSPYLDTYGRRENKSWEQESWLCSSLAIALRRADPAPHPDIAAEMILLAQTWEWESWLCPLLAAALGELDRAVPESSSWCCG